MRLTPRRVALGLLLAAGLVALVGVVRYVPLATDALDARTIARELAAEVRALGPGDLDAATVSRLRQRLDDLQARADRLGGALDGDPLVGLLRAVPPMATQLEGADALLDAADELVLAGGQVLELADRLVAIRTGETADTADDGGLLAGMVELMATSTDELDSLAASLDRAVASLDRVPADALGEIREARALIAEPLARYRPLLDQVRFLDDVVPDMAGWGAPRRYLVLAQNPAELRPAGGYVGTYGILELDRGRIAEMRFDDVYALDWQQGMPWQEPPIALQDHLLGRDSWELADSTWSPDFPTAAADALRIYTVESGDADIDGVIAITTFALDRLLEVTGPVEVPGWPGEVTPGRVTIEALLRTRTAEDPTQRKAFLDALADEVLRRLFALPADRWGDLLAAVEDIGADRRALTWFRDPAAQAVVAGTPVGGALLDGPGDHLYAVDGNVAPSSKLNLVVDRATDLRVELGADGMAQHALTLEWTNRADAEDPDTRALVAASEGDGIRYGTYTRVLVPPDAELIDAVGTSEVEISGAESIDEEAGRLAYGNYLMVAPGTASLSYRWEVPGVVEAEEDGDGARYRLSIQKQPGMRPEPIRLSIRAPAGMVVREATPSMQVEGDLATLETTLERDLVIDLVVGPP